MVVVAIAVVDGGIVSGQMVGCVGGRVAIAVVKTAVVVVNCENSGTIVCRVVVVVVVVKAVRGGGESSRPARW